MTKNLNLKVKFCGIRRLEDVSFVNETQPDYSGFILSDGFRRSVDFGTFCELNSFLDNNIKRVGVFVNEPLENILHCAYNETLDVVQLHGDEDENYIKDLRRFFSGEIWKAVRAKASFDIEAACSLDCDKVLIDSWVDNSVYGGSGKTANLEVIKKAKITKPFFLAGGLNAENISRILEEITPYGIDVSGGIETDGFKDKKKMQQILMQIGRKPARDAIRKD